MTNLETNKAISRRFNDLFDAGDLDGCSTLLAADMKGYATGMPGPMDRDAFRELGKQFHGGFSDTKHSYKLQVAEGDRVATYAVWTAINTGTFNGIPPTGKRVEMDVVIFDTFRDGKIIEHRGQFDVLALLSQMGAIPAAA